MRVQCKLTGLSGNKIYCMRLKGLTPSAIVIGNSIQSMEFLGGVRSAFRGIAGGEIADVTGMIHDGRQAAFARMRAEADREEVHGRDKHTWVSGFGGFDLTSLRAGG